MRGCRFGFVAVALLGLGLPGESGAQSIQPSPAGLRPAGEASPSRQESEWQSFRAAFPFHIQTLAAAAEDKDGSRTLIVSEPPPHVTIETLVGVDRDALASHQIQQWTIGFDGWVRDVVFRLPRMGEPQFDVLIRKLSAFLFATDYKHYCLKLPVNREAIRTKYPLDVQVQVSDLEGWFESVRFRAVGSNDPRRLDDAPPGVYLSRDRGLVAWVAPRRGLDARAADARMLALDSDLILGAVPRDDSVVIFGRERVAPVAVLPPLRAEMIFRLAATESGSLGQSYERGSFGAGSSFARWEWAPIYLSDELIDTEYGSVLNLADQLLKEWSEHGTLEYYNFPVETPTRYPFAGSLFDLLRSPELVYNWNTQGFGLRMTGGTRAAYTAARTGALPVIYRPEQPKRRGFFDWLVPGDKELLPATHRRRSKRTRITPRGTIRSWPGSSNTARSTRSSAPST